MEDLIETSLTATQDRRELAGKGVRALVILFMAFDGVNKVIVERHVVTAMTELGWPLPLCVPLGLVILACTALYAVRRTAFLGAILLTAFLGGATATHVRLEQVSFLFSILMGVLVWVGLYLGDDRVRDLVNKG